MLTPNGCGLSPDGRVLYFAETETSRLWALDLEAPGVVRKQALALPAWRAAGVRPAGLPAFRQPGRDGGGQYLRRHADDRLHHRDRAQRRGGPHGPDAGALPDQYLLRRPGERTAFITLSGTGQLARMEWPSPGLRLNFAALSCAAVRDASSPNRPSSPGASRQRGTLRRHARARWRPRTSAAAAAPAGRRSRSTAPATRRSASCRHRSPAPPGLAMQREPDRHDPAKPAACLRDQEQRQRASPTGNRPARARSRSHRRPSARSCAAITAHDRPRAIEREHGEERERQHESGIRPRMDVMSHRRAPGLPARNPGQNVLVAGAAL